jgi:hypothetical protein
MAFEVIRIQLTIILVSLKMKRVSVKPVKWPVESSLQSCHGNCGPKIPKIVWAGRIPKNYETKSLPQQSIFYAIKLNGMKMDLNWENKVIRKQQQ